MSKKFFLLLEEFSTKPKAEIGEWAKSLSRLFSVGIQMPNIICIPTNTLKLIAQQNDLINKIKKLINETNYESSQAKNKIIPNLKKLVIKQSIPTDISKEFLNIYREKFHSSYVSIQNNLQNIKGDANVIDAFLEYWADSLEKKISKKSLEILVSSNSHSKITKKIEDILFLSPILIQQQIDSEITGIAFTFDKRDGDKKRFTIKAAWGVLNSSPRFSSTYYVDSRTFSLIKKTSNPQETQFVRNLETLKELKLSAVKQNMAVLSDVQAGNLAKIISKIKKLSISQLKIEWGIQNNMFFISNVEETQQTQKKYKNTEKSNKKIYVSVGNSHENKIAFENADGFCIFNSGKLLSITGDHPMKLDASSNKKLLVEVISKTISKYFSTWENLSSPPHLIYRLQNLTSVDLLRLKHSSNFEVLEENPFLGLRGAARIIGQPNVFKTELGILKKILEQTKNKVSLLIPFSRSPEETTQVLKLIEKSGLYENKNMNVWLELSTPENTLNLAKYPLNKISGVVFNSKNIFSLLMGIDPNNSDIFSRYSDTSILIELIKTASNSLKDYSKNKSEINRHKLLVDLTDFDLGIINDVLKQDIEGVIINHNVTEVVKKCIINVEEERLSS